MCFYCKGKMKQGLTTHVVDCDNCIIIIKNVPCEECSQCGEIEYTDDVMQKLDEIVARAKELAQDVSVMDYSKVA